MGCQGNGTLATLDALVSMLFSARFILISLKT